VAAGHQSRGGTARSRLFKKKCTRSRRAYLRKRKNHGEQGCEPSLKTWKRTSKTLAVAIKVAMEKAWTDLIVMVDNGVWGKPYSEVMKRLRRPTQVPGLVGHGKLKAVVDALFSTRYQYRNFRRNTGIGEQGVRPFSAERGNGGSRIASK